MISNACSKYERTKSWSTKVRGRKLPYIGDVITLNPTDAAYRQGADNSTPRQCGYCMFERDMREGCFLPAAKKFFGIPEGEKLPRQMQGKEIGNYCRYWTHFAAE